MLCHDREFMDIKHYPKENCPLHNGPVEGMPVNTSLYLTFISSESEGEEKKTGS
jgi:hypothetical protein